MGPATSTTASSNEGWNIIPKVSTVSKSLRENHSVIKCRVVVENENKVKSHANTHAHTQLNCGNHIWNNWQRARHYQGQHKKSGIYYCIYAWTYVCNFVLWLSQFLCSLVTLVSNVLFVITVHTWQSIAQHAKLPWDYNVNLVLVYPVNECMWECCVLHVLIS